MTVDQFISRGGCARYESRPSPPEPGYEPEPDEAEYASSRRAEDDAWFKQMAANAKAYFERKENR